MLADVPWPLDACATSRHLPSAAAGPARESDDFVVLARGRAGRRLRREATRAPAIRPGRCRGSAIGSAAPTGAAAYASEALGALVDCAFAPFRTTRIGAGVFHDNPASRRVLEKLGFRGGRQLRDAMPVARRPRRSRPTCSSRALHGQRRHGDEVPRPGQGLYPLRRRRGRRGVVPPREIHRVRRAGRRRRRARRRCLGRGGRRAEHADRLPLPAALQGQDRRPRHGPQHGRRQGRRRRAARARRHADFRRGQRDADRRPDGSRRARAPRRGRQWRLRQRAFQVLDQPGAAPRQSGPGGARSGGSGCG